MYKAYNTETTDIKIYDSVELAMTDSKAFNYNWFDDFIKYLDATPKTVETYTRQLKQFFTFIVENGIKNPKREDVLAYRDYLKATGHKPTTVQNYIIAVHVFFNWTEQAGLYPNVAAHVKGAKLDKKHKKECFDEEQLNEIMANIDRSDMRGLRDYAILKLITACGLRTIEVVRADICDLRGMKIYIQGKGHEEKTTMPLTPAAEKAVRAYLKARQYKSEHEPLFTSLSNNSKGERLTTRSISQICKDRMKAAGYNSELLTAHSLRHTSANTLAKHGVPVEKIQKFMRHENIETTMIYIHELDTAKEDCSDVLAEIFGAD